MTVDHQPIWKELSHVARSSPRPPVMYDVARLAGVSHQTVSRVLSDHPNVREATRARVRRAIEQLDYRPNQLARGLVTRRSGRVGVISFESRLFGPTSTLLAIEKAARAAGYTLTISVVDADEPQVRSAVLTMAEQAVEGIIVIAPSESAARSIAATPVGIPVVAVEAGYAESVPVASVDQLAGARLATEHLLSLGHRTVWHVTGPQDWLEARERIEGWQASLDDAGVTAPGLIRGDWSPASGYRAGLELAARPEVTAVFVGNDQMALGLLHGLHERGIRVPRDVSVVGFDDVPEAAFFIPALTTVAQDFDAVGRLGVRLLRELIDETTMATDGAGTSPAELNPHREPERIVPTLVVRNSTAPAPRPGRSR